MELKVNGTDFDYSFKPEEILYLCTGFIAIFVDILISCLILHYRKLGTVLNIFMANRSIAELIRLLINPATLSLLASHHYLDHLFCLTSSISLLTRMAVIFFEYFMAVDWMMENCFPTHLSTWRKQYKLSITMVWAPIIFGCVWVAEICSYSMAIHLLRTFTVVLFLGLVVLIVILGIVRNVLVFIKKRQMSQSNYGLGMLSLSIIMRACAIVIVMLTRWFPVFLFLEHLLLMIFLGYLCFFCENFAFYLRNFVSCNLKDDSPSPEDDRQNNICQGCGSLIGFEEIETDSLGVNSVENKV